VDRQEEFLSNRFVDSEEEARASDEEEERHLIGVFLQNYVGGKYSRQFSLHQICEEHERGIGHKNQITLVAIF